MQYVWVRVIEMVMNAANYYYCWTKIEFENFRMKMQRASEGRRWLKSNGYASGWGEMPIVRGPRLRLLETRLQTFARTEPWLEHELEHVRERDKIVADKA